MDQVLKNKYLFLETINEYMEILPIFGEYC